MYRFDSNVKEEEYIKFIKAYNNTPITQELNWAKVKSNWGHTICGLYEDDELVAAALLLIKTSFKVKLIYSPHGFLINYEDMEILKEFIKGIRDYAKNKKAFVVKIDPLIAINEYPVDNREIPINFSVNHKAKIKNIEECGFIHKGYKKDMHSYIQPRFNMSVPLIDENNKPITKEIVLDILKKKNKNQVGEYQIKRGVSYTISESLEDIDDFYNLICETEKRQGINLRGKEYFENMIKAYGKRARIFMGKIDLDKYLNFIKEEHKDDDYYMEKELLVTKLKQEKGNILNICTALVIFPINEEGIRVSEYLYAGSNTENFSNLNIPLGLVNKILEFSIDNNCSYCNLGGVEGTLNDSLSTFKSKFSPIVLEYVGEFDLVINKFLYFLFDKFLPSIKKLMKRTKKQS